MKNICKLLYYHCHGKTDWKCREWGQLENVCFLVIHTETNHLTKDVFSVILCMVGWKCTAKLTREEYGIEDMFLSHKAKHALLRIAVLFKNTPNYLFKIKNSTHMIACTIICYELKKKVKYNIEVCGWYSSVFLEKFLLLEAILQVEDFW